MIFIHFKLNASREIHSEVSYARKAATKISLKSKHPENLHPSSTHSEDAKKTYLTTTAWEVSYLQALV